MVLEAGRRIEMGAGDWVHLDPGERHALSASEDSALLLTILFDRG